LKSILLSIFNRYIHGTSQREGVVEALMHAHLHTSINTFNHPYRSL